MFKAIADLGKDKYRFRVAFQAVQCQIYTNSPFTFKLQVQYDEDVLGKPEIEETKPIKVERSMKKTDIKKVSFPSQSLIFEVNMVVENG